MFLYRNINLDRNQAGFKTTKQQSNQIDAHNIQHYSVYTTSNVWFTWWCWCSSYSPRIIVYDVRKAKRALQKQVLVDKRQHWLNIHYLNGFPVKKKPMTQAERKAKSRANRSDEKKTTKRCHYKSYNTKSGKERRLFACKEFI